MSAELETLAKTVNEMSDLVKKSSEGESERIKTVVEGVLKNVLRTHPGFTPSRKVKFDDMIPSETDEILEAMPKELHQEMDKVYLLSSILKKHPKELRCYENFKKSFDRADCAEFKKALDSTTAGGVDEWVPSDLSPSLVEKIRLELKVAALFQTISMPTNPYKLPVDVGDFQSFLQPENTADTGQTIIPVGDTGDISGAATFTAAGHMTRVLTSKEATEDSIVPLMPLIQRKIVLALAQGREDAIINGDTGTHQDSDTQAGSAQGRRRLFKGLRALSLENSYTRDLATLQKDGLLEMMADMGVYGVNPASLAWITSIRGYINLMKLDEVITLDKMGPNAVILKGQLGSLLGIPVIVSEYVRTDLNSTGVYEADATKTVLHLVNRDALAVGERLRPSTQLLTELYAVYNQNALLATERIDFQSLYAIASNRVVNTGINIG
jgi:HK97 family phage major capsid protein